MKPLTATIRGPWTVYGIRLLLIVATVCLLVPFRAAGDNKGTGISIRDFFGVAQGGFNRTPNMWDLVLSANRRDVSWGNTESIRGVYDDTHLNSVIANYVLPCNERNAIFLPMLGYNTDWSWDRADRTYYDSPDGLEDSPVYGHATTQYTMRSIGNNEYEKTVYVWKKPSVFQPYAWVYQSQTITTGDRKFPLASDYVLDWMNYVLHTVDALQPYGVEYYQIWNEAHPNSGFWDGGLDEYMSRVHLPASLVIHGRGGKVVYGGWPGNVSVQTYINTLDAWDAWDSIDVLDMHYGSLTDFATLYDAAVARGRTDIGIWKTEFGFTQSVGKIGNAYPRFVRWALQHGSLQDHDRFKMFWFADWSPNSASASGYHKTLYSGDAIFHHGISLMTIGQLLDGDGLQVRNDVINNKGWSATLTESIDSIESFKLTDRTVIAIHTDDGSGTVTLSMPGFGQWGTDQMSFWRVDQSGYRTDLSDAVSLIGDSLVITVGIADSTLSPVMDWDIGILRNTFYVLIEVPHPGDANGDGMINLADLQILGDHWQSTSATWVEGDFTNDGIVGLADLQILGDDWGYGTDWVIAFDRAVELYGLAIPEPASWLILDGGVLVLSRRRSFHGET